MVNITPCPFCGSRADVMMVPVTCMVNGRQYIGGHKYELIVRCSRKCPGYGAHVLLTCTKYDSKEQAIRWWESTVRVEAMKLREASDGQ